MNEEFEAYKTYLKIVKLILVLITYIKAYLS